ncbi:RNI-like protein [Viridothelium virens]|uniref:RNI-like protein n=1 Tax=Viridothelium virens TaxID=1048519 RepID=A0A6A6HRC3_VIRVR|nr:RNI-like protein [Viridothelium virens]
MYNILPKANQYDEILGAPRRRSADTGDATLAHETAAIIFSDSPADSLTPIIKYEETVLDLRRIVKENRRARIAQATESNARFQWTTRIGKQGPWDEHGDQLSLRGTPSLPMPVQISDEEDLKPFFQHLRSNLDTMPSSLDGATEGEEPHYGTRFTEFKKGIIYEDRRLDLCKLVVGPPHIGDLMDSLHSNDFIRHFLLGNNIIGPSGTKEVASFIRDHPNKIETWYLAGNCINESSFKSLVNSLVTSETITNVWLKRNPLGPWSAHDIFRLITQTPNLRTLDLDQTELGDAGVATIFKELSAFAEANPIKPLPLRHLYLNANGIGASAAAEISRFLGVASCALESLYLSNNPLGDAGINALSSQLSTNSSLRRLSLQSIGLKDSGAISLFTSLTPHPNLRTLDVSQNSATEDLNSRYNYLTASVVPTLVSLISHSPHLEYLDLGSTAIPPTPDAVVNRSWALACMTPVSEGSDESLAESAGGLARLFLAVSYSKTLLHFSARSILPTSKGFGDSTNGMCMRRLEERAGKRLAQNVARRFAGMSYVLFVEEERRWLLSPEDVRKVDSVYRDRDAGAARTGEMALEKVWGGTVEAWLMTSASRPLESRKDGMV